MIVSQVLGEPLRQAAKSGSLALKGKNSRASLKEVKAVLLREIRIQRQSMGHLESQTCILGTQSGSWKVRVAPRCGSDLFLCFFF